jgi:hypothetical protein
MTKAVYSRDARIIQHKQIHKHNTVYKQKQGKNYMTLSIDAEKAFVKI